MPRLGCDDHADSAGCDHVSEFLKDDGSAIEVDLENSCRCGLRGRDPSGVDDADNISTESGMLHQAPHRVPRRDVDSGGFRIKSSIAQYLSCGEGIRG